MEMTEVRRTTMALTTAKERAHAYAEKVRPLMEKLRMHVDRLEYLVPDKDWPLVKYRELLFLI